MKSNNDVKSLLQTVQKEVDVLRSIVHPNIVTIKDFVVEQSGLVFILLGRVCGGELFEYIVSNNGMDESEAKFVFYQLLLAVAYLHRNNICHRDLKAENLLLETSKPFARLLLSDFGMSKFLHHSLERMQTKCGTFTYIAPEVIESASGYSKQVDCWSLGVLLYTMLAGALPFGSDHDYARLMDRIRLGDYRFNQSVWSVVSDNAKDLIRKLLQKDPSKRLKVDDIFDHPWIASQHYLLHKLYLKMLSKSDLEIQHP